MVMVNDSAMVATSPHVAVTWVGRFPRGHNVIEVHTERGAVLTLYVTKTGMVRVFKKGRELK